MRPGTTTIPRTRRCAEARWTTGSTAAVTVGATNVAANRRSRQCSSRDHGQRPRRELMRPVKIRSTGTQVGRAATCAAQPLLSAGSAPDGAGTHASVGARLEQHRAGSIRTDVRPSIHRPSMRYLMLMWADADATSGNESDLQAWLDFDERVKANGAFVVTEHSPPPRPMLASCDSWARARPGGGTPTVRRRRPADSGLLHHGSPQHGRRPRVGEQVANLRLR